MQYIYPYRQHLDVPLITQSIDERRKSLLAEIDAAEKCQQLSLSSRQSYLLTQKRSILAAEDCSQGICTGIVFWIAKILYEGASESRHLEPHARSYCNDFINLKTTMHRGSGSISNSFPILIAYLNHLRFALFQSYPLNPEDLQGFKSAISARNQTQAYYNIVAKDENGFIIRRVDGINEEEFSQQINCWPPFLWRIILSLFPVSLPMIPNFFERDFIPYIQNFAEQQQSIANLFTQTLNSVISNAIASGQTNCNIPDILSAIIVEYRKHIDCSARVRFDTDILLTTDEHFGSSLYQTLIINTLLERLILNKIAPFEPSRMINQNCRHFKFSFHLSQTDERLRIATAIDAQIDQNLQEIICNPNFNTQSTYQYDMCFFTFISIHTYNALPYNKTTSSHLLCLWGIRENYNHEPMPPSLEPFQNTGIKVYFFDPNIGFARVECEFFKNMMTHEIQMRPTQTSGMLETPGRALIERIMSYSRFGDICFLQFSLYQHWNIVPET